MKPISTGVAAIAGACALVAACGGSKTTPNGTPPGDDVGDDNACITPKQFDPCTFTQVACPDYVDACPEPYTWACSPEYGWELVIPPACQGGDAGSGDGGCVEPTAGASCTTGENACQPSDPCCAGYEWACAGTPPTWQKEGLGCACQAGGADAGPFACGTTTCAAGTFCEAQPPGIAGPDGSTLPTSYACVPVPSACAASATCGCIESTLSSGDPCSTHTPGVTCTSDTNGDVTVDCVGE